MKSTKPSHWTNDEWEDALRKIIELGYKKDAHWSAFYMCDNWDKYLSLPIVLTSSVLSTMSISQTASTNSTHTKLINYLITASSLLVTGLTTVSRFYNFAELKEGHRQACFNYLRLRSELVLQLNVPMVEYANFMKTYHDKWLSIRENSPNLPGSIVASIKEKTDNIEQNYLLKFLEKANAQEQQQQQQSNIKIKIKNDIESNYNKDTETDTETDTG